jgi:hypothetical protein
MVAKVPMKAHPSRPFQAANSPPSSANAAATKIAEDHRSPLMIWVQVRKTTATPAVGRPSTSARSRAR